MKGFYPMAHIEFGTRSEEEQQEWIERSVNIPLGPIYWGCVGVALALILIIAVAVAL